MCRYFQLFGIPVPNSSQHRNKSTKLPKISMSLPPIRVFFKRKSPKKLIMKLNERDFMPKTVISFIFLTLFACVYGFWSLLSLNCSLKIASSNFETIICLGFVHKWWKEEFVTICGFSRVKTLQIPWKVGQKVWFFCDIIFWWSPRSELSLFRRFLW